MTGDRPDAQQVLEAEAGKIIWAAASLVPGTPGHAGKTIKLIAVMHQLLRERAPRGLPAAEITVIAEEVPLSPTGRTPAPPKLQQLHPPGVDQAELNRLLSVYAKPGRRH
jgi:hypothetical protein